MKNSERRIRKMETLPIEILEKIFRDERLDFVDLSRLSCVSRRFKEIADSNETWMLKFKLSYPKLFDKIPLSKLSKLSWKQELMKRIKFKNYVRQEVESMSEKYFSKTELSKSDFHMFDDILVQHHHDRSNVHLYITDELANLIHRTDRLEDMTTKVGGVSVFIPEPLVAVLRQQEYPAREALHTETPGSQLASDGGGGQTDVRGHPRHHRSVVPANPGHLQQGRVRAVGQPRLQGPLTPPDVCAQASDFPEDERGAGAED